MIESITVSRPPRMPRLDEGMYDATITGVEELKDVATQFGVKDKIVVTFAVDNVQLRRRYTKSLYPRSHLYALVKELAGEPGDQFDVATLIDTPCRGLVSHHETDAGDVWENIDRVMKAKQPNSSTLEA